MVLTTIHYISNVNEAFIRPFFLAWYIIKKKRGDTPMNYSDLYFMISIALQLLIFFEIRRRSKSNVMLLMSLLITVLCVLFFYNVFLLEKQKTLFSFGMLVVVFLMFLWNVNYRFRKILK